MPELSDEAIRKLGPVVADYYKSGPRVTADNSFVPVQRSTRPMLCKLTEVMSATTSGKASAQRYAIDGTTTVGSEITVIDPFGVHEAAAVALLTSGAKGIAQPVAGGWLFYPLECA